MKKMLKLIDKNPDSFRNWGYKIISIKSPCDCKNSDPVTRYVCNKLQT